MPDKYHALRILLILTLLPGIVVGKGELRPVHFFSVYRVRADSRLLTFTIAKP